MYPILFIAEDELDISHVCIKHNDSDSLHNTFCYKYEISFTQSDELDLSKVNCPDCIEKIEKAKVYCEKVKTHIKSWLKSTPPSFTLSQLKEIINTHLSEDIEEVDTLDVSFYRELLFFWLKEYYQPS